VHAIDLLLRGAALGCTVLVGIGIIAGATPLRKKLALIAFFVLTACYLIVSSPALASSTGNVRSIFVAGAILAPVGFTWAVLEILFDDMREKWFWFAVAGLSVICAFLIRYFPAMEMVRGILMLLLYLGLLYIAIATGPDDLVERRRSFRRWFVACMALLGGVISVVEIGFNDTDLPQFVFVLQAAVFFILSVVLGLWIFTSSTEIWPVEAAIKVESQSKTSPKDSHLTGKLTDLMDAGIWREEGLTIGRLAERLGVPEHKLRVVINRELNFRNFSTFINGYRILAAMRAFDDPKQSGRTILEIAYDIGFSSLGPFNKAFRRHTGQSPREYRNRTY